MDSFLELLKVYLNSTIVQHNDGFFVQRRGICIGSCVAPVLCDIFLAQFDTVLHSSIQDSRIVRVFRYVDDFLVFLQLTDTDELTCVADQILNLFTACSQNLVFTHEVPSDKTIRFLDLEINFMPDQNVCWKYCPRSQKAILPYSSAHSKLVKRGIANLCFLNALNKSCPHVMQVSLAEQVERLKASGFPSYMLLAVGESLSRK